MFPPPLSRGKHQYRTGPYKARGISPSRAGMLSGREVKLAGRFIGKNGPTIKSVLWVPQAVFFCACRKGPMKSKLDLLWIRIFCMFRFKIHCMLISVGSNVLQMRCLVSRSSSSEPSAQLKSSVHIYMQ